MVTVKKPPFARAKWTHVVFTFAGLNVEGKAGRATLYLDGERQGELAVPAAGEGAHQFTWDPSKASILLGLSYIGLLDELAIFDRELTAAEVKTLHGLPKGVASLGAPGAAKE